MVKYWVVFKTLFKQKIKSTYKVFCLQLFATIVFSLMLNFNYDAKERLNLYPDSFETAFILLGILANMIYLVYSCQQNERFNRDQTWRLLPINDSKLYVINTVSSGSAFICFDLLLGVELIIALFIFSFFDTSMRKIFYNFNYSMTHLSGVVINKYVLTVLVLLLIGIAIYLTVSFLNFSSVALIDFWPNMSHRLVKWTVRIILLFVVSWLIVSGYNILRHVIVNIDHALFNIPYRYLTYPLPKINLAGDAGIFLLYDTILLMLNWWLNDHYVEAKADK
ncbi:hypothetical protein [Lactobacillus sp. ESL0681]|uniref:hypothetical protein n=1 Tax=Lactobacillus sp. ESL0681 TaxID=2983211 RepID=UPI0023F9FEFB|nr:hypothetical protein [Lactobacillus sp. ESL0681]WEV39518.1 hypothetical protein OZX59_04640 [Lactobacillus sp. ESL0681]